MPVARGRWCWRNCKRTYKINDAVPIVLDSMGWNSNIAIMPYNARFRMHRRVFLEYFSPSRTAEFRPLQREGACKLLLDLLDTPNAFFDHNRKYVPFTVSAYSTSLHPVTGSYLVW
jgi:cytochrome P450